MPIYEYECRACKHQFELLVLPTTPTPACPSCQSEDLEKQLSGFAVNSPEMSRARVAKARKAAVASKNYKDKQIAEADHIREHVQEHNDSVRTK